MKIKKLTVIIPVYNEEKTIKKLIDRVLAVDLGKITKELVVINDGSTDNTAKILQKLNNRRIKVVNKTKNRGKGAAIKTGMHIASGDVLIVQDADLEYNPLEYKLLLKPIIDGQADAVFGSRFAGSGPHRVLYFWHMIGNKFLTLLSNAFTNLNLTDMETCYKMFTIEVARKIDLEEKRFGVEPELTAKIAKQHCRIFEVGISYAGRSYEEGKKVNWRDGFWAIWCVVKYNFLYH